MENNSTKAFDREDLKTRRAIAIGITGLILLGTVGIAIIAIVLYWNDTTDRGKGLQFVGQTLLPLWGTWIGTVLVFFFSRENFEAASKSYQNIIDKLSPEEKMAKMNVAEVMLPVGKIIHLTYSKDSKRTLFDILDDPAFKEYNRYAVFTDDMKLFKMIHRSTFNAFIAERIVNKDSVEAIRKYTLEDMMNTASPQIRRMLDLGFNFVKKDATLLDAKKAMDVIGECLDIFVTENGKKEEPVIGLVTNNKILQYAVV